MNKVRTTFSVPLRWKVLYNFKAIINDWKMFSQLLLDCMGMWIAFQKISKLMWLWICSGEMLTLHYSFLPTCCFLSVSVIRYLFILLNLPAPLIRHKKKLHSFPFLKNAYIYIYILTYIYFYFASIDSKACLWFRLGSQVDLCLA